MGEFKAPKGVLRHLVEKGRGSEIDVTVYCNESVNRPPRLIITYPNNDHWASCRTFDFNQYIQVKLKHKVLITGYSYERYYDKYPTIYSMNWEFLASNDGNKWYSLDKHINDTVFSTIVEYRPQVQKGIYQYFRILNTGLNRYNNNPESDNRR